MKKYTSVEQNTHAIDFALLLTRVGIGAMMLTHGLPKLAMLLSGEPLKFPAILGMSPGLSLGLAIFAEVFCSLLLITGITTRLAVIPPLVTMIVALAFVHAADPFSVKEPAAHYLLVYLVLLFAGGGKLSLDGLWQHRSNRGSGEMQVKDHRLAA